MDRKSSRYTGKRNETLGFKRKREPSEPKHDTRSKRSKKSYMLSDESSVNLDEARSKSFPRILKSYSRKF